MLPALFIGRFQPFHRGHLDALVQCFLKEEKVIIAIGSALQEYEPTNPFTAAERTQMIEAALQAVPEYKDRYSITPVPNINDEAAWPAHVISLVPEFGPVYTGSALTKALFSQYSSHSVVDLNKNIEVSATDIRLKMRNGEDWEALVPEPVSKLINKWNGAERVKML